jgi:predicted AlkP superfamily phosphohydrolase/phosphomutase
MGKAIVIGLDGGTFDILLPLIERGLLPNIKRLMDHGVHGPLRTVIPPGTGPAWSSIVTGMDPSNHGVFDLIVRAEDSYNLAFLNASALRAPALWDYVGAAGGENLVLNVPMTYPPGRIKGRMVSGLLTPLGSRDCAYPPGFLDRVEAIEPGYKIVPGQTYAPGRVEAFMDEIEAVFTAKARVFKATLQDADWQFAMQVFNETDFLQHALWHLMDPAHPRHDVRESERFAERIYGFYRAVDQLVGEVEDIVGEGVPIAVISDHGHGPLHHFLHANNLLLEREVMKVRRHPWSRLKLLMFRAGFTPLAAYRLGNALGLGRLRMGLRWTSKGHDMLRRLFFSFSDVDWSRTRAYAISGGVYGAIFVNLEGREPQGCVSREDYEAARREVEHVLTEACDKAGESLVREAVPRETIYSGRFADEAPDIFFLPRDATLAVFGDFEFSSNRVVEPASEAISAQHRMDGIFIGKGPGLRRGARVEGTRVVDIAPLMLYLMGLTIPRELDGILRPEVLEDGILEARPAAYQSMERMIDGADGRPRSTEDQSIKDRLKGLGYIS